MAFAFDIILSCRAVSLLIILTSDTLESKVASSLILECWDFGDTCWAVQHTLYNLYIWQQGHGELVSILLEHGAEVDIINFQGRTFLHLACSRGHEKSFWGGAHHNRVAFFLYSMLDTGGNSVPCALLDALRYSRAAHIQLTKEVWSLVFFCLQNLLTLFSFGYKHELISI